MEKLKATEKEPLIGIGLPICDMVIPTVYYNHLAVIAAWSTQFKIELIGIPGMKITRARETITRMAMSRGCTHLLFIDSDHILPSNMLTLLMQNQDAAMVSGLIHKKIYPYEQVAFVLDKDGSLQDALIPENVVVEVDSCAMGCTLINLEKLKLLNRPYFTNGHFRHDINLCLKFKNELGDRILVDSRIHIGHVGMREIVYPKNIDILRKRHDETVVPTTSVRPLGEVSDITASPMTEKDVDADIKELGVNKPVICLSFDDCCLSQYKYGRGLKAYDIVGTFFINPSMIGLADHLNIAQLRMMHDEWNHIIANHMWEHVGAPSLSVEETIESIKKTDTWLLDNKFEEGCGLFALPYGSVGGRWNEYMPEIIKNTKLIRDVSNYDGVHYNGDNSIDYNNRLYAFGDDTDVMFKILDKIKNDHIYLFYFHNDQKTFDPEFERLLEKLDELRTAGKIEIKSIADLVQATV